LNLGVEEDIHLLACEPREIVRNPMQRSVTPMFGARARRTAAEAAALPIHFDCIVP
jgi:hypothetical protein